MSGADIEELESYHEGILKKYEYSGISSLSPSEVCLTLISPSWEYSFFKATKTHWLSIISHYRPSLLSHLKASSDEQTKKNELENSSLRQQAGKVFLDLLDTISIPHSGSPSEPSLKDDHILERLKEALGKKNHTLLNLLVKNDSNHDGFMNKSELVSALEEIAMTPHDIVALIRIAGYRPNVDKIPIAGFAEFLNKRGDDRKTEEYALFTKVLNAFNSKDKNLSKVFAFLDTNKDGVVTLEEMKIGLSSMNVNLTLAECKQVFMVLDKDRSGSISLDELKKRLNTLSTGGHEVKADTGKVSGSLEINVLKGQKFKAGAKTVKVKFGHNEFTSQANPDVNPEWKFNCTFTVSDQPLQKLPRDIEFEVFTGKKSEGKSVISLSDVRNIDVLKSKLDVLVNKQLHGIILVKSTWTEVQSQQSSGLGHLEIAIVKGEGTSTDLIFQVNNRSLLIPSGNFGKTFRLERLQKKSDMMIKVHRPGDENIIKELNLNDIIAEDTRAPYEIVIEKSKVFVQILWEEIDPEEVKEINAAIKIQAAWRGYLVRHDCRLKNPRKLVDRKVVAFESRLYLLATYENNEKLEIEVHPADVSQLGIDTVLSINVFPKQDLSDLIGKLTLQPDFTLGSVLDKKKPLSGDLQLELIQGKNLPPCILHLTLGKKTSSLVVGSSKPAEFTNLVFKAVPKEIECRLISSSNAAVIAECKIFWAHSVLVPNEWTANSIVFVGDNSSFIIKAKWSHLPDMSQEELAAIVIQKNWRAKKERDELKIRMRKNTLVGRRGITVDGKIYLVSVKELGTAWVVELHPADNPQVPTFDVIDQIKLETHGELDEVLKKVTVVGEKIKIN